MTKIIGLTGGIGSGKSTVAGFFKTWGVPVYIADDEAKKLMQHPEILNAIVCEFGHDIIRDGTLDKAALSAKVFSDSQRLKKLNEIIHPAVRADFTKWVEKNREAPFVIKEAAILFESGSNTDCDAIITISAPVEIRIDRVLKRDNMSREQILARINSQWTDTDRESKSDYVIQNLTLQDTEQQAYNVYKALNTAY